VQGLGIITPTHSLHPGIRVFWEYRVRGDFWTDTPEQLQRGWGEGGKGGMIFWSAISEQQQIVRIDQKRLSWKTRAQGIGQMDRSSRNAVSFDICQNFGHRLTDQTVDRWLASRNAVSFDNLSNFRTQIDRFWQLTDVPVKKSDSDHRIGWWEWLCHDL
jgi:hypothetical protein